MPHFLLPTYIHAYNPHAMRGTTHAIVGVLAGAATYTVLTGTNLAPSSQELLLSVSAAAVVGSLLPDIDHTHSTISRLPMKLHRSFRRERNLVLLPVVVALAALAVLVQAVSAVIHHVFGHRTITHSLLGLAIFGVLGYVTTTSLQWPWPVFAGFLVGCGSHLLADSLTPTGVPLLWPFRRTFQRIQGIRIATGSKQEAIFSVLVLSITALWIWRLFINSAT